ncbi:AraC family transcriptional regulator N-terminal domain-containing protein [Luteibacter sp. CQ10]|uniref:AraC family transcriptional regulator n=1 Tax=Luteibacter sp. CQ10 TaxID=2805821 RepID=UPI0034A1F013
MPESLAEILLRHTTGQPGQGAYATAIEGLTILRSDHPKPPAHQVSRPGLCVVAQGAKWAAFGDDRVEYRAGQALLIGVETPSIGRVVEASPDRPCLVLMIELDVALLRGVAEDMAPPPRASAKPCRGVFVTDFQGALADCVLRLARLLDTPRAIPTLLPGILREMCYWLLAGPHAGDVARIALAGSPTRPVVDAMRHLRERFREPVRIAELAALARMSASAFHRQFKALTSLTPLQYQKRLRLMEARRLMIVHACHVETAAFEVGYESPSQFNREYARLFGAPPKRDVVRSRATFAVAPADRKKDGASAARAVMGHLSREGLR